MENEDYTLKELLVSDSFRKWVRGEANVFQKKYWDRWVMSDEQNRELANDAVKKIIGFSLHPIRPTSNPDKLLNNIQEKIDQQDGTSSESANGEGAFSKLDLRWVYRVAAAVLLIITTSLTVFYNYSIYGSGNQHDDAVVSHRVLTGFGEQKTLKMEDGSTINLNANSELTYKIDSSNPTQINIDLRGEAYFDVSERTSQSQHPFVVHTEDGVIQVLGTEFSVSTRDHKTQVVLENGSVEVAPFLPENKEGQRVVLEPSQLAEFNDTSDTLIVQAVNTSVYTSWKEDALVFDSTPLPVVIKRLEHTFGVEIIFSDPKLKSRNLSGRIENTNIDVILSTLSETLSTSVRKEGRNVYIGGK